MVVILCIIAFVCLILYIIARLVSGPAWMEKAAIILLFTVLTFLACDVHISAE